VPITKVAPNIIIYLKNKFFLIPLPIFLGLNLNSAFMEKWVKKIQNLISSPGPPVSRAIVADIWPHTRLVPPISGHPSHRHPAPRVRCFLPNPCCHRFAPPCECVLVTSCSMHAPYHVCLSELARPLLTRARVCHAASARWPPLGI
jgi:hypothetical protein